MSGSGRMSGNGREALGDVQERSGGPLRCPGVFGRPSGISGSGWEALGDVGSSPEALTDVREWSAVREWSGGPAGSPEVFGSPSEMSGSGREAIGDVREW